MLDLELAIWWRGGGDETFFAPTRSSGFSCLILGQFLKFELIMVTCYIQVYKVIKRRHDMKITLNSQINLSAPCKVAKFVSQS